MARQSATWKAVERQIAEYIGGKRIPVTGRHTQETPDIQHHYWAPEVKHSSHKRGDIPDWLLEITAGGVPLALSIGQFDFIACPLDRLKPKMRKPALRRAVDRPLSKFLRNALQQATTAGAYHKRRPVVILHQKRQHITESLCLVPLNWTP